MMWLKNRLVRNIVISVLGLGILGGVYFAVMNMDSGEEPASEPETFETDSLVQLIKYDESEVKEIKIKNTENEYTFIKTKINLNIKNNDGTLTSQERDSWTIKGYEHIDFNRIKMENAIYDFINVNAEKLVDETEDIAQYGFDSPLAEVEIMLNDGTLKKYYIGNKVVGSSEFFAKTEDNKIYSLNNYKSSTIMQSINEYREVNVMEISADDVQKFKASRNGEVVVDIRKKTDEEISHTSLNSTYMMTAPRVGDVTDEALDKYLDVCQSMIVGEFIEDNPKNLSKYGLDVPAISLEIADTENSYVIHYGNKTGDGRSYVMIEGKNFVFTHNTIAYNTLLNIDVLGLMEKYAHLVNIKNISSVTVSGAGAVHEFSINEDEKYFVDGGLAKEKAFKAAYEKIIGLTANGFADFTPEGQADYVITFKFKDGSVSSTSYISYDDRNYAVVQDGQAEFIILKKSLEEMMERVNAVAANPEKIDW